MPISIPQNSPNRFDREATCSSPRISCRRRSSRACWPNCRGSKRRSIAITFPGIKKGGSISRFDLDRLAPAFGELYRLPALAQYLDQITGRKLLPCPPADPHTYALYYYTEEGDHIGWHYDTSYYRGKRYTVLIGLVDRSDSRLEYRLPPAAGAENAGKTRELAITPGMLVLFGDKLHHRVTPIGANQKRVVLTLEYVTDTSMSPWWRFVSYMKDSFVYFGLSGVFQRRERA